MHHSSVTRRLRHFSILSFEFYILNLRFQRASCAFSQVSVHRRETEGGEVTHHAWLAEGPDDPRPGLARFLLEVTEGASTPAAPPNQPRTHVVSALTAALTRGERTHSRTHTW